MNENFNAPSAKNKLNSSQLTTILNDFIDKYSELFSFVKTDDKYKEAVVDLIEQAYKAGLAIGRNESPLFAVIPMAILENKNLSANAKLLYGEIIALSKKDGICYATNEHLSNVLGLKKTTIKKLLGELQEQKLIDVNIQRSQSGTYRNITVSFFTDKEEVDIYRGGGAINIAEGGRYSSPPGGDKYRRQKRNIQREIDKENMNIITNPSLPTNEINYLIKLFEPLNPNYERLFPNKTQRKALERMIKKFTFAKMKNLIEKLPSICVEKYAPKITTPLQLEEKMGQLKLFLQSKKEERGVYKV